LKQPYRIEAPLRAKKETTLINNVNTWLLARVRQGDSLSLLDVGCGNGQLFDAVYPAISSKASQFKFMGYDCDQGFVDDCVRVIRNNGLRREIANAKCGEFEDIIHNISGPFDVITIVELLSDLHLRMIPRLFLDLVGLCHDQTILVVSDIQTFDPVKSRTGILPWSKQDINEFMKAIIELYGVSADAFSGVMDISSKGDSWWFEFRVGMLCNTGVDSLKIEEELIIKLFDIFEKKRETLNRRIQDSIRGYRNAIRNSHASNEQKIENDQLFFKGHYDDRSNARNPHPETTQIADVIERGLREYWACESEVSTLV